MSERESGARDSSSGSVERVAVLRGGVSLERSVSLSSGAHVQEALRRLGYDTVAIDPGPDFVQRLGDERPDVAFVALHGGGGEDGTVQELLEALAIPYTGSGPAACMRCADKALAKFLMREAGIPTPEFRVLREPSVKALGAGAAVGPIERALGFPVVVKPAGQGSAIGVKFAHSAQELPAAMVGAFSYDRKILIERYVKGRDLAVSVLDAIDGSPSSVAAPSALPVVEAIPREEDFYNYESRYEIGMTTFVCPAELDPETTARSQQLALDTYRLLGCRGVARVDLMLDEQSGELLVLETNSIPGMTDTSLLPQAADAAGIGFDELVGRILASALR
ncbi:MAG TPA: D-alanine--D-alanine ligase [Solirubrobacteraceae bacterium]|jgi:D-alanine-D-alanine ligase|nr:D-alanine--D-alanine ligase [Solirubrobacteraceae bacterium]